MTRKRRGVKFENYTLIFAFIMVVVILAVASYSGAIGLNTAIGTTLIPLFPTLLVACMGIYMLYNAAPVAKFGGTIAMGLAFCLFLDTASAQALITADMLGALTLVQVQVWVMVFSIIGGAVLYSMR